MEKKRRKRRRRRKNGWLENGQRKRQVVNSKRQRSVRAKKNCSKKKAKEKNQESKCKKIILPHWPLFFLDDFFYLSFSHLQSKVRVTREGVEKVRKGLYTHTKIKKENSNIEIRDTHTDIRTNRSEWYTSLHCFFPLEFLIFVGQAGHRRRRRRCR